MKFEAKKEKERLLYCGGRDGAMTKVKRLPATSLKFEGAPPNWAGAFSSVERRCRKLGFLTSLLDVLQGLI